MYASKINQQSIFFPAAGCMEGSRSHDAKTNGRYMTSIPYENYLNSM